MGTSTRPGLRLAGEAGAISGDHVSAPYLLLMGKIYSSPAIVLYFPP